MKTQGEILSFQPPPNKQSLVYSVSEERVSLLETADRHVVLSFVMGVWALEVEISGHIWTHIST